MEELQSRQKVKRFFYSTPALILILLFVGLVGKATLGMLDKEKVSRSRVRELEASVAEVSNRREAVEEELNKLDTPEGVKALLKERLNVTNPDEKVAIIVEGEPVNSTTTESESWWRGVLDAIIGR